VVPADQLRPTRSRLARVTLISTARGLATWALVRTRPSWDRMTPEPMLASKRRAPSSKLISRTSIRTTESSSWFEPAAHGRRAAPGAGAGERGGARPARRRPRLTGGMIGSLWRVSRDGYQVQRLRLSEIEPRWQSFWEENRPSAPRTGPRPKYYVLDMFPYPSGRGCTSATRRATRRPTSSRATSGPGLQRAAPHGLGRLRPARRAARGEDRAPTRPPTPRTTSPTSGGRSRRSAFPTTGTARSTRPTRSTSGGRSGSSCSSSGGAWPTWTSARCGGARSCAPSSPTRRSSTAERGGRLPRRARNLRQWVLRITAYAERLLADLAGSTGPTRPSGCRRPGSAAARAPRSSSAWSARRPAPEGLHDPARHALRLHLHGPRARASPGGGAHDARAKAAVAAYRRQAAPRATWSAPTWRRTRPASSPAPTPSTRSTGARVPDLGRRLRADGLRHGRHHGRAGARRARLRVRDALRPADRRR
jgi:hypothetical protein